MREGARNSVVRGEERLQFERGKLRLAECGAAAAPRTWAKSVTGHRLKDAIGTPAELLSATEDLLS